MLKQKEICLTILFVIFLIIVFLIYKCKTEQFNTNAVTTSGATTSGLSFDQIKFSDSDSSLVLKEDNILDINYVNPEISNMTMSFWIKGWVPYGSKEILGTDTSFFIDIYKLGSRWWY